MPLKVDYIDGGEHGYPAGPSVIVTGLRPDEPVFVLRGQDAAALATVQFYQSITSEQFGPERAAALVDDIAHMKAWRADPNNVIKDAD